MPKAGSRVGLGCRHEFFQLQRQLKKHTESQGPKYDNTIVTVTEKLCQMLPKAFCTLDLIS